LKLIFPREDTFRGCSSKSQNRKATTWERSGSIEGIVKGVVEKKCSGLGPRIVEMGNRPEKSGYQSSNGQAVTGNNSLRKDGAENKPDAHKKR